MTVILNRTVLLGSVMLALTACGGAKEKLGLTKSAPDEFAVVKRAPLEMPPVYTLRPPQPGAPRPQETHTSEQAREVVFGGPAATPAAGKTNAEALLLQQTGGTRTNPEIRSIVDRETATLQPHEQPVVKRLLNVGKPVTPPSTVVDPVGEAARLRKNQEEGRPVTAGETPSTKED